MRENGLRAAAYVAVVDLHPQVADVMLEALAEVGVAAYAAPVGGARGLLLPAQFPTGPLDRLFVDREAYATARRVLDEHLPGARAGLEPAAVEAGARAGSADDAIAPEPVETGREMVDDDTWSRIVAAFHGGVRNDDAPTPDDQSDDGSRAPSGKVADESSDEAPSAGRTRPPSVVPLRAWPEAEDLGPNDDDDLPVRRSVAPPARADDLDRYVPPIPPPLPTTDPVTRLAWAGVVGGPVLFILALLLDWDLASWAQLAGVTGLVLGFITLVARMRDDVPDDDPDNGAVV